jgi:hypothetical protein
MSDPRRSRPAVDIGLNAVIAAVTDEVPRVLTVRRADAAGGSAQAGRGAVGRVGTPSNAAAAADPGASDALPFDLLDPGRDRTLELAVRQRVWEQTGRELGYVEQLYTFGDLGRDPRVGAEGVRAISVAYLALVREAAPSGGRDAGWRDVYRFLPWEDWRDGRPALLDARVAPALARWVTAAPGAAARRGRRERADITFGLGGVAWDGERVLERYELLYEAGLVTEHHRDRAAPSSRRSPAASGARPGRPAPEENAAGPAGPDSPSSPAGAAAARGASDPPGDAGLGRPMALDHRRILATALGRLRGKIRYRPVVFELLPPVFTLLKLQRVVEALAGVRLHKQNFRRLVERGGLVEGTGELETATGGRPAELFRFRREVLRERPAPGVGLPGARR